MSSRGRAARWLFPEGHRYARFVPLLLVLTFVSGLVDAASFLGLGRVFVANMTGNVAFLGFALSGVAQLSALASAAALAGFLAGAVAGGAWRRRSETGALFAALIGSQSLLVAQDPAEWLPTDTSYHCTYVATWVGTKLRWDLAADEAERDALLGLVEDCPTTVVTYEPAR
ncbi:YoaK family protein [Streptomyces hydrogenans]|uniref:YoaK family protein n=1 Tax=Streptomyces hydrogenans TaxID=1873719 RepID=UPI003D7608A3